MEATVTTANSEEKTWGGGNEPMGASYGKLMMWFFIVSDALTFSGFLAAYGFSRFKFIETWPLADEVFTHFPFMHGVSAPMYYVALMTFILIFSSVTMVLAVDAGHQMKKNKVIIYMFLTIIGGMIFVGSQAWEWKNFIKGEYGAIETKGGSLLQFVDKDGKRVALADFSATLHEGREQLKGNKAKWFMSEPSLPTYTVAEVQAGFKAHPDLLIRTEVIYEGDEAVAKDPKINHDLTKIKHKTVLTRAESEARLAQATFVVEGANLTRNEYGSKLFADFFFFITGFHGFHVFQVLSLISLSFLMFFLERTRKERVMKWLKKLVYTGTLSI